MDQQYGFNILVWNLSPLKIGIPRDTHCDILSRTQDPLTLMDANSIVTEIVVPLTRAVGPGQVPGRRAGPLCGRHPSPRSSCPGVIDLPGRSRNLWFGAIGPSERSKGHRY